MYFTTCRLCGATLDPGEKCTCMEKITKYRDILTVTESGQMEFDLKKKKEPVT